MLLYAGACVQEPGRVWRMRTLGRGLLALHKVGCPRDWSQASQACCMAWAAGDKLVWASFWGLSGPRFGACLGLVWSVIGLKN